MDTLKSYLAGPESLKGYRTYIAAGIAVLAAVAGWGTSDVLPWLDGQLATSDFVKNTMDWASTGALAAAIGYHRAQ